MGQTAVEAGVAPAVVQKYDFLREVVATKVGGGGVRENFFLVLFFFLFSNVESFKKFFHSILFTALFSLPSQPPSKTPRVESGGSPFLQPLPYQEQSSGPPQDPSRKSPWALPILEFHFCNLIIAFLLL